MHDPSSNLTSSQNLELVEVSKRYGRKIVFERVDHRFTQGLNIFTGPSGSGKSTLLRILASAEAPSSGEVVWRGEPIMRKRRAYRRTLGYAPQSVTLPEGLTAREFATHIAALKGLSLRGADQQFLHLCQRLSLFTDANNRIATFSGGMRRRLIFALALLGSPSVLILDEPTAELDQQNADRVVDLIKEAAEHATVVMTTHNLAPRLAADAELLQLDTLGLVQA